MAVGTLMQANGGIKIADNSGGTINIGNATLTNTKPTAIDVTNSQATINVTDTAIVKDTPPDRGQL